MFEHFEKLLNETSKKDKLFIGLFLPLLILSIGITVLSLISGIILRQDAFMIIIFVLFSLFDAFLLVSTFLYIMAPKNPVKFNKNKKIVEICRVFHKNYEKIDILNIEDIEVPKTIFTSFISFSKVKINIKNSKSINLYFIKTPEGFKKCMEMLTAYIKSEAINYVK